MHTMLICNTTSQCKDHSLLLPHLMMRVSTCSSLVLAPGPACRPPPSPYAPPLAAEAEMETPAWAGGTACTRSNTNTCTGPGYIAQLL